MRRVWCGRSVWVKGDRFSIEDFVDDKALAAEMRGGSMVIFRLAPQDYHRFHWPVSGKLLSSRRVHGKYYTVNPIAVNHESVNVFTENKRVVNVVQSPALGKVVFVNIGATAVGSIKQLHKPGAEFTKGDCFGYFQFGKKSRTCHAQAQCGSVLMRCCSQGVRPALC